MARAAQRTRGVGITSEGPVRADTVFVRAMRSDVDVAIACYHAQRLIPVKLVAFGCAGKVTLGLPMVRTSVDNATAFDVAVRGYRASLQPGHARRLAANVAEARA